MTVTHDLNRWTVRTAALFASGLTLALLGAGALVNSRQAALSVPDWPRSYGQWILFDRLVGNAVYEHVHRLLAVLVGLGLAVFLRLLWRASVGRRIRGAALSVAALYVIQILLGGAVVLMHDPPWLAAIHFLVGQALTVGVVLLALVPFGLWRREPVDSGARLGGRQVRLAGWTLALLVLQVLLGTLARHPASQTMLIVTLLGHLANGLALLIVLPVTAISTMRRSGGLARPIAVCLVTLFVLQLVVAGPLFIIAPEPLDEEWPPPDWFAMLHVAHVVLAALLLSATSLLRHEVRREVSAGGG